jgi:conjugative transfer signal peptidase TraF
MVAGLWIIAHTSDRMGLRINTSPSMPIGLWSIGPVRFPLARGMIISFCPPTVARPASTSSNHLPCPNGLAPFLKPIVALPGDGVSVSDQGVAVNGRRIERTERIGDVLTPRIAVGEYRVPAGHVWVVSNHHPRSFDSRYFGPVKVSVILGLAKPVLCRNDPGLQTADGAIQTTGSQTR